MVAVAIVGCSKDGSDSYITAESVTISPSRVELQPGKTTTLRATVLPANVENKTVQWISHNEYVATVDPATGVVTAHALGQATIIAQAENGVSGECTVVVVRDPQEVNRDRAALMDLYNALGGDNWAVNTNWGSDKPLTEWHGVEGPRDTGKIERIDLYMNNMAGEIPASLANLTDLVDINLANNNISGPLPATLGTLPKLKYLAVFGNRMSGKIPASVTQNADLWNNCWAHIIWKTTSI